MGSLMGSFIKSDTNRSKMFSNKILNTFMILILGGVLGVFSKWLDEISLNDDVWWHNILSFLDLGNVLSMLGIWILIALCISIYSATPLRAGINVFVFFLAMNINYHLYTIFFAGFNPMSYMMIWYGITLFSPILAFICWYSKGYGIIPIIINIGIITVMILCSFAIGMWYFDFISFIDTMIFIITLIVLYETPKKSIIALTGGFIVAFMLRLFI